MSLPPPSCTGEVDVFLSHATPDKEWVRSLADALGRLGIRVWLDERELRPGQNWVLGISDALAQSRYLALVLSSHSVTSLQEWTAYVAEHARNRLIPIVLETVDIPTILKPIQAVDGTDRDAARVAGELFTVVGDPTALQPDDPRRLFLGRDLVFTIAPAADGDAFRVIAPNGTAREVPVPWKTDAHFGVAWLSFTRLTAKPVESEQDRADLIRHARVLGELLFGVLFDEAGAGHLAEALRPGRARPVITISSEDDEVLGLPWELLHHNGSFLIRDDRLDLERSTPGAVAGETLLREPSEPFKLVVNVSAPEGSRLSYEAESYRITLALTERCLLAPTELGTLEDLCETVRAEAPTGIHFSGHGMPGGLVFEDDEGGEAKIPVDQLLRQLRLASPEGRVPPFLYLASCHGNDPAVPEKGEVGSTISAARLHREGITQVVGYFGPVQDELSTRAEEALYEAIALGETTRHAIRRARAALATPFTTAPGTTHHRPMAARTAVASQALAGAEPGFAQGLYPFAWAQLVLYHRGPGWPLSTRALPGQPARSRNPRRTFKGLGTRRMLEAGFIGRRGELHRIRRWIRGGNRALVLQGLGGLGKSTLATRVLSLLAGGKEDRILTVWCHETEAGPDQSAALLAQLIAFCRARFGLKWEAVGQAIEQQIGADPTQRFLAHLQVLLRQVHPLVLYLDNLESLLIGPQHEEVDSEAFGRWATQPLEQLWSGLDQLARDGDVLFLVASCRYRNQSFRGALFPVSPLPNDALFRLMAWFPGLAQLSAPTRARLVGRLEGHPRAVELTNDLIEDALARWRDERGERRTARTPEEIEREWEEIVAPALPDVARRLRDDLLLTHVWAHALDDAARRMLYRLTLLRGPAEWDLLALLGEPDQPDSDAQRTAERLRATSLLEQVQLHAQTAPDRVELVTRYTLHPATRRFVQETFGDQPEIRRAAHLRLGEHLEVAARNSRWLEARIEGGHHLFEAGELDRSYELLGSASDWLRNHGSIREGIQVLAPFLPVIGRMRKSCAGAVFGTLGIAHASLGELRRAIELLGQALAIARETGDREAEGGAFGNLGVVYFSLGDVGKAIGFHEQRLGIAREIGDRRGECNALGNLGSAHLRLREAPKAIAFFEQSLAIAREIGHRRGEGSALGNLGSAYFHLGEVPKAISFHEQDLAIARETGNRSGEGSALCNLGVAHAFLGEVPKAIGFYEQHLAIAQEVGDSSGEGTALGNLGVAYVWLGEPLKAIQLLEAADRIGREIGDPRIFEFATAQLERLRR